MNTPPPRDPLGPPDRTFDLDAADPPPISPWAAALRVLVLLGAMAGVVFGLGAHLDGAVFLLVTVPCLFVGITAMSAFAVPDDPIRWGAGGAPVSGSFRLAIEYGLLALGAVGFAFGDDPILVVPYVVGAFVSEVLLGPRRRWLLER